MVLLYDNTMAQHAVMHFSTLCFFLTQQEVKLYFLFIYSIIFEASQNVFSLNT